MTDRDLAPSSDATATADAGPAPGPLARLAAHRGVVILVLVVSTSLLLTQGAAIVALPVTAPLLFAIAGHRPGAARIAATILAMVTIAEGAWAATYVVLGEHQPWIWLLPLAAALATLVVFLRHAEPQSG